METPCVYFIQVQEPDGMAGPIKIGCSVNPSSRISALFGWCPYPLSIIATAPGCRVAEGFLHKRFAQHRIHGEWFRPEESLVAFARGLGIGGTLPEDIPNTVGSQSGAANPSHSILTAALRRAGMSVRDLAAGMGVPEPTVIHWAHRLPEHRAVQVAEHLTSIGIPTSPLDLFERFPKANA